MFAPEWQSEQSVTVDTGELSPFENEILAMAWHESAWGESHLSLAWDAAATIYPGIRPSESLRAAEDAVHRLLGRGLIEVCRAPRSDDDLVPLPSEEAQHILRLRGSWPGSPEPIFFRLTPAGEASAAFRADPPSPPG